MFLALVPPCAADILHIAASPDLIPEEAQFRVDAQQINPVTIEGSGDRLEITYISPDPIALDIAPQRRGSSVDPAEILHVTLPAGEHTAIVDITATPGWSPLRQAYVFWSFTTEKGAKAEISGIRFLPASYGSILNAALHHLSIRETYQVSLHHTLRGTMTLGWPFALPVGILTLVAAGVISRLRRRAFVLPALITLSIGALLFGAWSGIDLTRFTVSNLRDWYGKGIYSQAGSAALVSERFRKEARRSSDSPLLYVCHDKSDFYPKMLRYFLYPLPVSSKPEDVMHATHVIVARTLSWKYKEGLLTCGGLSGNAKKIAEFPDASVLFAAAR